jgi:hypothetical protein
MAEASVVDAEYRFGRPKVYLTPHELARLVILRSRLGDIQAERLVRAADERDFLNVISLRSDSDLNGWDD